LKINWNISIALVCLVLGLLIATSYNTQQRSREALNAPRKKDLIKTIHELEKTRDDLNSEIRADREQLAKYEKLAAKQQGLLSTYTSDLDITKQSAGLTTVKGKGVVISLADSPQYPKDDRPDNYIIHDYDIRLVVNSLRVGGAKAISINGQRLISTSSIRCAGGYVLVNTVRLVSPFIIKAVGDPNELTKALNADSDTKRLLTDFTTIYGLKITVEQKEEVIVPGYSGSLHLENSRVIEGGT